MNCIDLTSKRSKMLSYVAKHSKQRKTTKAIKFDFKKSKNDDLRRKTFKATLNYESDQIVRHNEQNVELRPKTLKTTLNYKSDKNTMSCIDLMSKRSKQRKTPNAIKLRWIACIWHQNEQKCWVTSQNIQNKAKLQKWSKYHDLHRFDVKTIKATQNSKRDQITMNLHRFDVKTI